MAMRTAAKYAAAGCLVKPVLLTFLQNENVDLDIHLNTTWTRQREFDGWFHASAHPSLTTEELIAYLQQRTKPFEPDYISTMSTIFGSMLHSVVQAALDYMKISVPLPEGLCVACGLPRKGKVSCHEHGAVDHRLRSRGHLDAIGNFGVYGVRGIDIKSIKPWGTYGLKDAPDMDLAFFMERWPKYYGQGQDYMRMTGLRQFIFFFITMGNPWEMREYHVPYDEVYAHGIEQRYRQARQMAA
jgi:hypothetical protein